jgi:ribosomal protein S27AE
MPPDQEFLLYPLDTGEDPLCPRCHLPMLLAAHEARYGKPAFLTFRCEHVVDRKSTFARMTPLIKPGARRSAGGFFFPFSNWRL